MDSLSNLKYFLIPYRYNLGLPDNIYFGIEIEFKMPKYNDIYISNFINENNATIFFSKRKGI